ncbi:hypothetical protein G9F32_00845 [Acinetobacter sp. 194]|uniref:type IV pilus assembly protein FimV n=1 Tax=Acinetobacter shaoyimingii TaxID=2715164 RepID=UPI001409336D|nr:FimV/HubP family polar landmark protein [Acinetobacter shaoyimingii]NHB56585.1 hypothetical protein [Acinetobacter shaoyimingii]
MTIYNKLKIAILTVLSTQTIHAITFEPVQIQSGSGDLLYAEIKFRNANANAPIEASLAGAQELLSSGLSHQPPGHLNFYTRRSGNGTGVIVITSTRPIHDKELNVLIKVREGDATHVHQVKTPLTRQANTAVEPFVPDLVVNETPLVPQMIVSEKDIDLNLPTSTQYEMPTPPAFNDMNSSSLEAPVAVSIVPNIKTDSTTYTTTTVTVRPSDQPPSSNVQATTPAAPVEPVKVAPVVGSQNVATTEPKKTAPKAAKSDQNQRHIVQANESLWKIASRIATQTNQSVPEVMKNLQENNKHAFVNGNINRIRQGTALNLAAGYRPETKKTVAKKATKKTKSSQKPAEKTKYRLNDAEMSLVAESDTQKNQNVAKENLQQNSTTQQLSSKVMTAREKTVKLQKSVSESTQTLRQKDQRIQLLNAKLAQLQQQLQQQNQVKKPSN